MTARANWFLDVDLTDYTEAPQTPTVQEVGVVLDLRSGEDMGKSFVLLVSAEQDMFNRGIRCPIRQEHEGSICSACPIKHTEDDDPLTALCTNGVQQERLATNQAILAWHQAATPSQDTSE